MKGRSPAVRSVRYRGSSNQTERALAGFRASAIRGIHFRLRGIPCEINLLPLYYRTNFKLFFIYNPLNISAMQVKTENGQADTCEGEDDRIP